MSEPVSRAGLKTFSAFAGARRRPSEYDIVTYKLHCRTRNPKAAYEQDPDSKMNIWYRKYVTNSPLQHSDWDSFRDPDQVIYRAYNTMQDGQEQYVDQLLDDHDMNRHDFNLPEPWVDTLALLYTPARYLFTTLQMSSAYLLQVAPASTITNCAAFQEADAFRWVSRIAYRTKELSNHYPDKGFALGERSNWENAEPWQGFRELMEKLMIAYDWGETLIGLNVVAIRAVDEAFIRQLGHAARAVGDTLTAMLCDNQFKDAERSRRWTAALVKLALERPENKPVIEGWVKNWTPLADKAADRFCAALPNGQKAAKDAKAGMAAYRQQLGLT